MTDKSRERFESWAAPLGYELQRTFDDPDGDYVEPETRDAWAGYRAALSQPAVAGAVDEMCPECEGVGVVPAVGVDGKLIQFASDRCVTCDATGRVARTASPSQPAAEDGTLGSCPFCGKPLNIRRSVNPHAECRTDGCFGRKMSSVNLDDTLDVTAWNTRASPADDGEKKK